jgi:hypothetical protein|tara:strand:+ start:17344 stop:17532 length:189 start_codon:yes stop_codon:yes gene_type:complete
VGRRPPTSLKLNGLEIEVFKTKVKIYDKQSDVTDVEAEKIIIYLYNEGFIEKQSIVCEIIEP